jgi:hypothetical protein
VPTTTPVSPYIINGPQKSKSTRTVTDSSLGSIFSKLAPGPIPDSLFERKNNARYISSNNNSNKNLRENVTPSNVAAAATPSPPNRSDFAVNVMSALKNIPINASLHCYERAVEAATGL